MTSWLQQRRGAVEKIDDVRYFSVPAPWDDNVAHSFQRSGLAALELNYAKGFAGESLDFVRQFPELERLIVIDWDLRDVRGVEDCRDLTYLQLHTGARTAVDLSRHQRLTSLALSWASGLFYGVEQLPLERLFVERWSEQSLEALAPMADSLVELRFKDAKLLSQTETLEAFSLLRKLELVACRKLTALPELALPNLDSLSIAGTRQVTDLSPAAAARRLRRLDFGDCREITSLAPLASLVDLEEVYFSGDTVIRDG